MTIEEIFLMIGGNVPAAVFLFLWWNERSDRKLAERRLREVLREISKLPDEILTNGDE